MPLTDFENPTWWMSLGLCRKEPAELFFPKRGADTWEPKKICRGCPVKEQCLEYAIDNNIAHGIWGGKSERERKQIRYRRNQALRAAGIRVPGIRISPGVNSSSFKKSS